MTLPNKAEKSYLAVEPCDGGFVLFAKKPDADALAALFLQYGISCSREPDARPGEDALRFVEGVERAHVERVLQGYVTAKGS